MGKDAYKYYNTFAGCDAMVYTIFPNAQPVLLGQMTTISYSIFRDKKPVPLMNRISVPGFTKGPRFVAGTMIFTLLNRHWTNEVRDQIPWLDIYGYMKADELPPFDIMVLLANEYGVAGHFYIYGVQVNDEGQVLSIEDIFTENQFSFIAEDIDTIDGPKSPQEAEDKPNVGVQGITVYGNHTDIDRNKSLLDRYGYRFVYTDVPGFNWKDHVINKYDIILGGTGAVKGVGAEVPTNGAGRLWGSDRYETSEASKMFMDFLYENELSVRAHIDAIKKGQVVRVYGTGADLANAKKTLKGTFSGQYEFHDVASEYPDRTKIPFRPIDIALGAPQAIEVPNSVNLNGALRLEGLNKDGTLTAIQQYNNMVMNETGVIDTSKPIDGITNATDGTRVWSGPGTEYKVIDTLPFGTTVKVTKFYPEWLQITNGYVDRKQITIDQGNG